MNIETFFLGLLEGIGNTNFSSIGGYLFFGFVIFWFAIVWWVWFDASARTTKVWAKIASVILVTVFNIFGLIIYLIVRPDQTIEGTYWEDLERRYMKYETSELGDCPKCGAQLYPGFIHCSNCGYELKVQCPKCELFIDRSSKYCPFCGVQISKKKNQEEIEIEPEVMEEQVRATKEEITNVVESDKTKYSRKESIAGKIGESVIGGYKILLRGIVKRREEKKVNEDKERERSKKDKEQNGKVNKDVEEEQKRKDRAKKKKRKKKKKKHRKK